MPSILIMVLILTINVLTNRDTTYIPCQAEPTKFEVNRKFGLVRDETLPYLYMHAHVLFFD